MLPISSLPSPILAESALTTYNVVNNLSSATDKAGAAGKIARTHKSIKDYKLSHLFFFPKRVNGNGVLEECLAEGTSDSI